MRQLFADLRRGLVIGVGFVLLVSVSVGLVLADMAPMTAMSLNGMMA